MNLVWPYNVMEWPNSYFQRGSSWIIAGFIDDWKMWYLVVCFPQHCVQCLSSFMVPSVKKDFSTVGWEDKMCAVGGEYIFHHVNHVTLLQAGILKSVTYEGHRLDPQLHSVVCLHMETEEITSRKNWLRDSVLKCSEHLRDFHQQTLLNTKVRQAVVLEF